MPRTFTTLVAETPAPATVIEGVERTLGTEYSYDRHSPKTEREARVRIEGGGWFYDELNRALEGGEIAPIRWAVVMWHMDEAIGVNAWVYRGNERIDEFQGEEAGQGADTEEYLEQYHGIVVDSCGPYQPAPKYDPVAALSDVDPPSKTLVDQ